jgi:hypothetical protein
VSLQADFTFEGENYIEDESGVFLLRGDTFGPSDEEVAFYDALATNGSAKQVMGVSGSLP